jgi:hypothetical protein
MFCLSKKLIKKRIKEEMNYLQKLFVVLITGVALSGCAGKGSRVKQIQKSPKPGQTSELIMPTKDHLVGGVFKRTIKETNYKALPPKTKLSNNSYLIDEEKSFEIVVSENGYTRFSIEDERITDVFIHPQENIQLKIHDQGYLIVVPKQLEENLEENAEIEKKINSEKIYVTITGEHGTTQDFSLRFTGKTPEPVKFVKSNPGITNLNKGE